MPVLLPFGHVVRKDAVPVGQDVIWLHPFQQAAHLDQVLIPSKHICMLFSIEINNIVRRAIQAADADRTQFL